MIIVCLFYGCILVECNECCVGGFYINEGEATTAAAYVLMMFKAGVCVLDIVVIFFYVV